MMGGKKRGSRGRLSPNEIESRYRWLWKYHKENHRAPTQAEMAVAWGISPSVVRYTLLKFHDEGWLVLEYHKRRSVRLLRQLD